MGTWMETYRGDALAWEIDELGHLNMRFYPERAMQGRISFFSQLGLKTSFFKQAFSTILPLSQHIMYHREIRPGDGIVVETAILETGETDMTLIHMIYHSPKTLAASVVETVSHISTRTQNPFPWPDRIIKTAKAYKAALPKEAKARNLDMSEKTEMPDLHKAQSLGMQIIGRGTFQPAEMDVFGTIKPSALLGRVSDSVLHLTEAWPDIDFQKDRSKSSALLEARCMFRNKARPGDIYEIHSGLRKANTHTRQLCHWILNPLDGKCWASMVGVACIFDLNARKLVKIPDEGLALLRKKTIPDLYF